MPDPSPKNTPFRIFSIHKPTPEDLARAATIAPSECPRRYCWWWQTLAFDWNLPPAAGCTFSTAKKPHGWQHADATCKRADPTSPHDQFEPREPHLMEDGFSPTRFQQQATP
jgi:hypothetical protein